MSHWIKLEQLPEDFWGECFAGYKNNYNQTLYTCSSIVMIRKFEDGCVKWYCNTLKEWFDFRGDLEHRIMIVKFPTLSDEDFK